jgi:four helix bundle protein
VHWRDLKVWQASHQMVLEIYRTTQAFPGSEKFGLSGQLKRASSSIPANIVEGQSRNTTKEYLQFLYNARGSLEEVRYFILLARDLRFLTPEKYIDLETSYKNISRMLNSLIKSLKSKPNTRKPPNPG